MERDVNISTMSESVETVTDLLMAIQFKVFFYLHGVWLGFFRLCFYFFGHIG